MADFIGTYLFLLLIVNTIFALIVAYVAKQKGRSYLGLFTLSFFFTFFVGMLVVLALPKVEKSVELLDNTIRLSASGKEVKCPYCAEWVKHEAKVCRYCGKDIGLEVQAALVAHAEQEAFLSREREAIDEASRQERDLAKKKRADFRKTPKFIITFTLAALFILSVGGVVTWIGLQPQLNQAKLANYKPSSPSELSNHWQTSLGRCDYSLDNKTSNSSKTGSISSVWFGTMNGSYSDKNVWEISTDTDSAGNETMRLYATSKESNVVDCLTNDLFGVAASRFEEISVAFGENFMAESNYNKVGGVYYLDLTWNPNGFN